MTASTKTQDRLVPTDPVFDGDTVFDDRVRQWKKDGKVLVPTEDHGTNRFPWFKVVRKDDVLDD
jgi:hypothetical protein